MEMQPKSATIYRGPVRSSVLFQCISDPTDIEHAAPAQDKTTAQREAFGKII